MRIGDFQPIDLLFPEQGDRVDEGDTVDCRIVEFDLLLEVDKLLHEAVWVGIYPHACLLTRRSLWAVVFFPKFFSTSAKRRSNSLVFEHISSISVSCM